ncbi:hypothetical protein CQ019_08600 [Arthrobacter sp. MYb229]|nr:hypothetical protein CQ019_08600 [Arthrobacter sp. MYb229]PRB51710.1 hypothetical protein CQ013_07965 [Arthrobacter sp. MYb216]
MQRFLKSNKPRDLAGVQKLLRRYREHYNQRRPHQSSNQATPQTAGSFWSIRRLLSRYR